MAHRLTNGLIVTTLAFLSSILYCAVLLVFGGDRRAIIDSELRWEVVFRYAVIFILGIAFAKFVNTRDRKNS